MQNYLQRKIPQKIFVKFYLIIYNLILKPPHIILEVVFMRISDFSYPELIALASSLSIAISKELCIEDIGVLAAFFTILGDNLAIISLKSED